MDPNRVLTESNSSIQIQKMFTKNRPYSKQPLFLQNNIQVEGKYKPSKCNSCFQNQGCCDQDFNYRISRLEQLLQQEQTFRRRQVSSGKIRDWKIESAERENKKRSQSTQKRAKRIFEYPKMHQTTRKNNFVKQHKIILQKMSINNPQKNTKKSKVDQFMEKQQKSYLNKFIKPWVTQDPPNYIIQEKRNKFNLKQKIANKYSNSQSKQITSKEISDIKITPFHIQQKYKSHNSQSQGTPKFKSSVKYRQGNTIVQLKIPMIRIVGQTVPKFKDLSHQFSLSNYPQMNNNTIQQKSLSKQISQYNLSELAKDLSQFTERLQKKQLISQDIEERHYINKENKNLQLFKAIKNDKQ